MSMLCAVLAAGCLASDGDDVAPEPVTAETTQALCTDGVRACNAAGDVTVCSHGVELVVEDCFNGCSVSARLGAHCRYVEPSFTGLADACDAPASTPTLTIASATAWDTDNPATCTGGVASQGGGTNPTICVVRAGAITIASGATLTVYGTRVLALIGDTAVTVGGTLDASASGSVNGPGGGWTAHGSPATAAAGGAGFRTAGGAGGTTIPGGAANGGPVVADPSTASVVHGGARGTLFGSPVLGRLGGGGGGAAVLVACRGLVSVPSSGLIDVGGGGGWGGGDVDAGPTYQPRGAAGGGAGGFAALQGLGVSVNGKLFANGGGGGGGTTLHNVYAFNGADGTRVSAAGASGGGATGNGGTGGVGAFAGLVPGSGGGGSIYAAGGGGGGSTGYLRTYTPSGTFATLSPVDVSPALSANLAVGTR